MENYEELQKEIESKVSSNKEQTPAGVWAYEQTREQLRRLKEARDVVTAQMTDCVLGSKANTAWASTKPDMVNYPPHYTRAKIEHIDVIDAFFKDNYYLGQVFKYTMRAGHKGNEIEDLEKAKWYLDRYIKIKKGEL